MTLWEFCLIHYMQGAEGDKNVDMAMKEPERFVAKPQREGGGEC